MANIPNVELCFCNKQVVERMCWYGCNAGRRSVNCENGCGYIRWVEPPLEPRAAIIIEDLQNQLTRQLHRHEYEMAKLMESFNIQQITDSEDEIKNEDEDDNEIKNEDEDVIVMFKLECIVMFKLF